MKKATLISIGMLLAIIMPACGWAQSDPGGYQIGLQAGVSHSGWNLALVGGYRYQSMSGYIGPAISLNRGLPSSGPWGLNAGLNYHIPSSKSWLSSIVNLDYQLNVYHSTDLIHECNFSYGLSFDITENFSIIQQLGYGFYIESVKNPNLNERKVVSGYDGLVRLKANYNF